MRNLVSRVAASPAVRMAVRRFVRIVAAAAIAGVIAGIPVLVGLVPAAYLPFVGPVVTAVVAALDKYRRELAAGEPEVPADEAPEG